jgi:hypothetical protein
MSTAARLQPGPPLTLLVPPGTHWRPSEDAHLRAAYGQRTATDLAAQLGRGVDAVRQRARFLGLARRVRARITWTPEADAILRAGYRRMPSAELAAQLGTTVDAVWARAKLLKVTQPGHNIPWTADEDRQLRELYGAMPLVELAARIGRTHDSVSNRLHTVGLTRETAVASRQANDQAEIARLRAENDHLKHGALDAAHAPTADARRLATLMAYRLGVIDPETAAVVLGVPVERLGVEVGKAAAMGLDVVRQALGEGA